MTMDTAAPPNVSSQSSVYAGRTNRAAIALWSWHWSRIGRMWYAVALAVLLLLLAAEWPGVSGPVAAAMPRTGIALIALLFFGAGAGLIAAVCVQRMLGLRAAVVALAAQLEQLSGTEPGRSEPIPEMGASPINQLIRAINDARRRCAERESEWLTMQASCAHDLRTPLTRMRLALEYVDEARRGPLLAEISQMETMISGSLAFAGEDARLEPHQRVDLAALLISLCDEACDRGDEAAYVGPDHAELPCQPIAMRRAFANLIDNGCRYGARVRVTLATAAEGLRIDIDDDGPGIAPELRERAFAPFQRLDNARAAPGSGLGLSIARSVIRGHGGDVVLGDADGGGLRARIELPLPD